MAVPVYPVAEKGCITPFQGFPHPSPLPEGEGIRGSMTPARPIEEQTDMLKGKYYLPAEHLLIFRHHPFP